MGLDTGCHNPIDVGDQNFVMVLTSREERGWIPLLTRNCNAGPGLAPDRTSQIFHRDSRHAIQASRSRF